MKYVRSLILLLFILGCAKGGDDPEPDIDKKPIAVALEFPLENALCTTGVDQGTDKSLVVFRWAIAENDSYELVLENLATNEVIRKSTSNHEIEVVLDKNAPYAWYVLSRISDAEVTADSPRWKFYAAGDGVSNYAPFPAELISPEEGNVFGESVQQITLNWQCADIDDEAIQYDVYVGTENPPEQMVGTGLTEQSFDIPMDHTGDIFWRIVTHDENNNSSYSKVGRFGIGEETGIVSFEIQQNDEVYSAEVDAEDDTIRIRLGNFDYKKLAPQITLKNGYSINPASGEIFNFHDDLFYIVTDPEGNKTIYNVLVESGQHEVESFNVRHGDELYIGEIDSETGIINLEMGNIDYSSITPEIMLSNRATIEPTQVSEMDLRSPIIFTVTSEIGTTKEFTVQAPIAMSGITSYFLNPGFKFVDAPVDSGYKIFAGSTQYISAFNIQDRSQIAIELIDQSGSVFLAQVYRDEYWHQHGLEDSSSSNYLTVEIPSDLPQGSYGLRITEGPRSKSYPHRFEVINDDRVIRITEINKNDFSRGDTLIMKGVNLRNQIAVKSNANIYIFNHYTNDLTVNADSTEMRLIFSSNVYGNLKSWGTTNEKPLAIQTLIDGYPHNLNSNIIYFNVN